MVGAVISIPPCLGFGEKPCLFCCMSKLPLLLRYETVAGPLLVAFK